MLDGVPPPVVVDWSFEFRSLGLIDFLGFGLSADAKSFGGQARKISEWGRLNNNLPHLF